MGFNFFSFIFFPGLKFLVIFLSLCKFNIINEKSCEKKFEIDSKKLNLEARMEFNDMLKKMMDAGIGMATASAEKMAEFAEQMAKKGQESKENNNINFEHFFTMLKEKFEEHFSAITKKMETKGKKIEKLEKEVEDLKKQVEALTKKNKA